MKELITINNQQISLEARGERVFTTSLDIARVFEKEHKHIMEKIRELPDDDFRGSNFRLTEQIAKFGVVERKSPYYNITRDGFAMLVMGFTGSKAYQWKTEYIKAFNFMEARLRGEMVKPVSVMDYLQSQLDVLRQQEARLISVEQQAQDLHKEQLKQGHNINRLLNNDNYLTVIAYANLKGIPAKAYNASAIGRKAKRLSEEQETFMGAMIDPRFGRINTYDTRILEQVFSAKGLI